MRLSSKHTQVVATALTAALLITVPGLPFYQACAAIVDIGGPVTSGAASAAGVPGALLRSDLMPGGAVRSGVGLRFHTGGLRTRLQYKGRSLSADPRKGGTGAPTTDSDAADLSKSPAERLGAPVAAVAEAAPQLSPDREIPATQAWSVGNGIVNALTGERWRSPKALFTLADPEGAVVQLRSPTAMSDQAFDEVRKLARFLRATSDPLEREHIRTGMLVLVDSNPRDQKLHALVGAVIARDIRRDDDETARESGIGSLRDLALATAFEEVRAVAARKMVRELRNSGSIPAGVIFQGLSNVALRSAGPGREAILRGIMNDVRHSTDDTYRASDAIKAVERIAMLSRDPATLHATLSLMRAEAERTNEDGLSELLQESIARLVATGPRRASKGAIAAVSSLALLAATPAFAASSALVAGQVALGGVFGAIVGAVAGVIYGMRTTKGGGDSDLSPLWWMVCGAVGAAVLGIAGAVLSAVLVGSGPLGSVLASIAPAGASFAGLAVPFAIGTQSPLAPNVFFGSARRSLAGLRSAALDASKSAGTPDEFETALTAEIVRQQSFKRIASDDRDPEEVRAEDAVADRFLPLVQRAVAMNRAPSVKDFADRVVSALDSLLTILQTADTPEQALDVLEKQYTPASANDKLRALEAAMKAQIKGQDEAIDKIVNGVRREFVLPDSKRPVSFLLLGRDYAGKQKAAEVLAEQLFGSKEALLRLDMSNFAYDHSATELLGTPPGYAGYGISPYGSLTEAVRRQPKKVLLVNEVEKANDGMVGMLSQMLGEGSLTDGKGKVDFSNTYVLMTSEAEAPLNFRPELRTRIGTIIRFDSPEAGRPAATAAYNGVGGPVPERPFPSRVWLWTAALIGAITPVPSVIFKMPKMVTRRIGHQAPLLSLAPLPLLSVQSAALFGGVVGLLVGGLLAILVSPLVEFAANRIFKREYIADEGLPCWVFGIPGMALGAWASVVWPSLGVVAGLAVTLIVIFGVMGFVASSFTSKERL